MFLWCFHRVWVGLSCSERLFARILGFPRYAEQNTIWILNLFLPMSTLECLSFSQGFWDYSNRLVPSLRFHMKRGNMLLISPLVIQAKNFPEIFSTLQIAFLRKERNGCWSGCRKMWCRSLCQKDATNFFHSSRVKLPFVWMSASWFLDVDVLDLDFAVVQVDSVKITSPEQLGGCGIHVSSSGFGLWWSSLSKLRCLRKCTTEILSQRDVRSKDLDLRLIDPHSDPWMCFGFLHRFPACTLGLILVIQASFQVRQWPNPTSHAQVNHPNANQHPTILLLILWSCEIPTFASYTSNWSVQMFDFQKCTKLRQMLNLSLQDPLHETTQIDNVEPHYHHDNIGGNHSCNECRR